MVFPIVPVAVAGALAVVTRLRPDARLGSLGAGFGAAIVNALFAIVLLATRGADAHDGVAHGILAAAFLVLVLALCVYELATTRARVLASAAAFAVLTPLVAILALQIR